ncbi:MAG TPA: hypothetical protein IAD15_11470 [Candidatus Fimiplasma intestinipullorum]|uniref:Uncharacterized protein n=1 Tax=Candidatus Fimiplasma intestinipullorum TaxID=2840825 RepID=A0A9D1L1D0_9FIRM|nr:hypothetical protein [Candidatus Fimiplasma intestinipullorum]
MNEDDRFYYIIPDNFKQGRYIMSRYNKLDLMILLAGCGISILLFLNLTQLGINLGQISVIVATLLICIIIIYICFLLTMNVPFYHNALGKLQRYIYFRTHPQIYISKGVDYYTYEHQEEREEAAES